ncbi:MAG: prephenate dehydratase [Roseofilum sp. SBFL]|uniref:prephenate dehydratase n=1 Tax=unclassified Roseofilum TaxID=2620099 RepID=UPI001B04F33C|nr:MULTISPECIES: prephenate dehydratase [unclassified Roseofilum]MBP0015120.1 prephenate dehydratase [Roseofilum sp. SID3]MBP0024041.1 prephenate dehydratase [Roseofilum sp. SID2]MBP0039355.1 prephenate dehydratase [Roseofilum sp. SID1]MBP0042033.1 prephenate dehydratase [Roseofilum sp. SBFL]
MVVIAYLGPRGTYSEAAGIACSQQLKAQGCDSELRPYPSIAQTLQAVAQQQAHLAIAPVENSIEGSVPMTLDSLWQLQGLDIQQAYVLPITHGLLSQMGELSAIKTVYSHPQALAQCQEWLEQHLPGVKLIPTNSTTESIQYLQSDRPIAAISSQRAAKLYQIPILAYPINDRPDNCTRFWVMSSTDTNVRLNASSEPKTHTSIAFSLPNIPGVLVKPLEVFAHQGINLSRIESRPTKRSLGEYLFFIDIEVDAREPSIQQTLQQLEEYTEVLKIFGSYTVTDIYPS